MGTLERPLIIFPIQLVLVKHLREIYSVKTGVSCFILITNECSNERF